MGLFDSVRGALGGDGDDEPELADDVPRPADHGEPTPTDFRNKAVDAVQDWDAEGLDFSLDSLDRLDQFADRQGAVLDVMHEERGDDEAIARQHTAYTIRAGSYFGEVLVRAAGGQWTRADEAWAVQVPTGDDATTVDTFEVAAHSFAETPAFTETARQLGLDVGTEDEDGDDGPEPVDVRPEMRETAEEVAATWEGYALDFSPASVVRLDDLVEQEFDPHEFDGVDVGGDDMEAKMYRERLKQFGSYFGEVLVRRLDGEWNRRDGEVVVDVSAGSDGWITVPVFDVAGEGLRGAPRFVLEYNRCVEEAGLEANTVDPSEPATDADHDASLDAEPPTTDDRPSADGPAGTTDRPTTAESSGTAEPVADEPAPATGADAADPEPPGNATDGPDHGPRADPPADEPPSEEPSVTESGPTGSAPDSSTGHDRQAGSEPTGRGTDTDHDQVADDEYDPAPTEDADDEYDPGPAAGSDDDAVAAAADAVSDVDDAVPDVDDAADTAEMDDTDDGPSAPGTTGTAAPEGRGDGESRRRDTDGRHDQGRRAATDTPDDGETLDLGDGGGETAPLTAATVTEDANQFAATWPGYDLDFSPKSLERLDRLVREEYDTDEVPAVTLDGSGVDDSYLTARIVETGGYFAEVLRQSVGGEWQAGESLSFVIDGRRGETRLDPVAIAADCFRGEESFAAAYADVRGSIGASAGGDGR